MTVARPRQAVCSVRDACRRLRQAGHTGAAAAGVGRQVEQGQASAGLELGGRETCAPRAVGRAGPGQVERAARDILQGRVLVAMVGDSRFRPAIPAPVSRRQGGSEQAAAVAGGRGHGEPARASGRGDGETGLARGDILKINPARGCTLGLRNSHDIR